MKKYSRLLCVLPLAISLLVFSFSGAQAQGPKKGAQHLDEKKSELWESLSEEERKQLKEALRKVWSDPTVISARDEVQQASEAYHRAMKAAISRADPAAGKLLSKMNERGGGAPGDRMGERRGPGGPFSRRGDRPVGEIMGFPAALEGFSDEERTRFREAESKARAASAVKEVLAELASSRENDDAIRKGRLQLYQKLRKVMLAEMVKIDPEIEALVVKLRPVGSGPRPGGKDSGRPAPKGKKRTPSE